MVLARCVVSPSLPLHGAHTENDQIRCLISRDFQNSLRRRGELLAELEQAFRMTPWLSFRRHQFLEAAHQGRLEFLQVRDACGGLLDHVEQC